MKVRKDWVSTRIRKDRKVAAFPCLMGEGTVLVANNNLANLGRALEARVFREKNAAGELVPLTKPSTSTIYEERCQPFIEKLLNEMPALRVHSMDEVIESYTGGKRSLYRRAKEEYLERGVSEKDAHLKAFVKVEKLSKEADPRLIQPRSPVYNLRLGRYLKLNEKEFYYAINRVFGGLATCMKGLNIQQRGHIFQKKWRKFRNPIWIGMDQSRMDAHCSVEALLMEHKVYTGVWPNEEELKTLLSWQINQKGLGIADDGCIEYELLGGRASGDMNTSVGNYIIMCMLLHAWLEKRGLLPETGKTEVCDDGDDAGVMMEAEDYELFSTGFEEWMKEMGFIIVVEKPVSVFEEIEFCQSHPVWTPKGYVFIRNPKTALARDAVTTLSMTGPGDFKAYLGAVGICGLTCNLNIPVQYSHANAMFRHGTQPKRDDIILRVAEFGAFERMKGLSQSWKDEHKIHPKTRLSYWSAFGITPAEQLALESYYDNLTLDLEAGVEVWDHDFPKAISSAIIAPTQ